MSDLDDELERGDWPGDDEARCRVCGCTEDHACAGGCAWVPKAGNLCTACESLIVETVRRVRVAGHGEGLGVSAMQLADSLSSPRGAVPPLVERRVLLALVEALASGELEARLFPGSRVVSRGVRDRRAPAEGRGPR